MRASERLDVGSSIQFDDGFSDDHGCSGERRGLRFQSPVLRQLRSSISSPQSGSMMGSSAISFGKESSSPPGSFSDKWNRSSVAVDSGGDDLTVKRDHDNCSASSSGETSTVPVTEVTSRRSMTLTTPCSGARASPRPLTTLVNPHPLSMFHLGEASSAPAEGSPKEETPQYQHRVSCPSSSVAAKRG